MIRALSVLAMCGLLIGVAHAQGQPSDEAARRNQRGAALQQQGKLDEALAEFRQAAQADPDNITPLINMAYAYGLKGQVDEAITEYRKVLAREPGHAVARNNLGVLLDRKGLHHEAIQEFEEVLRRDPANASAVKNLDLAKRNRATIQARENDIKLAVKDFDSRPRDSRAAYTVARLYAVQGQLDQALEWLTKAVQLGFSNLEQVAKDPALARLRDDPRFTELVERRRGQSGQPR